MDVRHNINRYLSGDSINDGRQAHARYASFDYCYNYFQTFREQERIAELASPAHLQLSCLHIGFYLASWGMLRGSSFLLQKSARHYRQLINTVTELPASIWKIDVDAYTTENIAILLECADLIAQAVGQDRSITGTLTTKIMLGIFGNVPAFDSYFQAGLNVYTFNQRSLQRVAEFYREHHDAIDHQPIQTLDFDTGELTNRPYPKAKLIDMVGFIAGIDKQQGLSR